jgi:hypothetical protein
MSTTTEWKHVLELIGAGNGLTVPRLDPGKPYTPDWLRERAAQADDPAMADLLTLLADYPALNAKLNRNRASLRHQNIALHYQIACALEPDKKKAAVHERIGNLWCISAAHVKDVNTEHGPTAVQWLANFITYVRQRADFTPTRLDVLTALDSDMAERAKAILKH